MGVFRRLLHVHLAGDRLRCEHVPIDDAITRALIGGVGLGAHLLWRYAPRGVDPLAPAAPLIFALAPLLGTPLTTTAKLAVICKSPLTGRISDGLSSSRFALAAKRLGVDAIVLTGALDHLSIVHLDEDPTRARVEPCPALAGASPAEVGEALAGRRVAAIGPAGERLVRFATLTNDGRHAGRGGAGALLGAKRVKAITVHGDATPPLADPAAVRERAKELARRSLGAATDKYRRLGTVANLETFDRLRILPARNFQRVSIGRAKARRLSPEGLRAEAGHVREGCAGCTIGCDHRFGGTRLEYESLFALGPLCGIDEPAQVLAAAAACDRLGVDTISAGGTLAFAMECAERGLVPWPIAFGDDLVPWLEKIAAREGIGDLLAEGSRRVAARVGQGSERFACQVKGLELPGYEPRTMQTMALGLAVAARGADHNRSGAYQADLQPGVDRFAAALATTPARVIETEDHAALLDALILCKFLRGAIADPWVEGAELLAMTAGIALSPDELREAAARIVALRHLYNRREGWTIAEDTLPARFFDEPLEDGAALSRELLAAMVAAYHEARGLGVERLPARERLDALFAPLDLGPWAEGLE
ncbi:MAG: aldehyde:ferredoxin oxidoreductase [Myxococcales bacterium]|nr:aldehyde:ferredoxin oxidoreductase [Myxococcales bacterium]